MAERNLGELAQGMRSSGWVRFIGHDLDPKSSVNTNSTDIARQVLASVFKDLPDKFRLDERPEVMEVRYHWSGLEVEDRENILKLLAKRVKQNQIARERGIENNVFDQIYFYLNLQGS